MYGDVWFLQGGTARVILKLTTAICQDYDITRERERERERDADTNVDAFH